MGNLTDDLSSFGISIENVNNTNEKIQVEAEQNGLSTTKKENEQSLKTFSLTAENRHLAVRLNIVPKAYENSSFDVEQIRKNLIEKNKGRNNTKTVHNFNKYVETCNGILSALRLGYIPERSYIIGAPSKYGKASFVYECLMTMLKNGFRVTPYIALNELAHVRDINEQSILEKQIPAISVKFRDFGDYGTSYTFDEKATDIYVKRLPKMEYIYEYYDYINADCLFVQLSGRGSKEIESYTLSQLLNIRGVKGLPTIVMTSDSVNSKDGIYDSVYYKDTTLKNYVWDDILTKDEKDCCYDRLFHVSCWEAYESRMANKGVIVDKETGIAE